jgi:hypothetical protein
MSLQPEADYTIPEMTARVARRYSPANTLRKERSQPYDWVRCKTHLIGGLARETIP